MNLVNYQDVRVIGMRMVAIGVVTIMLLSLFLFHGCVKKNETANNTITNNTNQQQNPAQELNQDIQQASQDNVNLTDLDSANIDTSLFE